MVYIQTITIQGFKSYRDQTQIEPFSAGHNVVVGRNGSGKSNFFAAIRFVLSDAYTSMSREERQSLLHEGISASTTLSAYVEIVFDNSDSRFPTSLPTLTLRRTIGLKKDEYSLDRKSASKADVMNLLESAGFSKSNPYYIVPQGRITSLTNAKDHERLTLLKEVAGTKVYEQRRSESLRLMEETDAKRAKISELLQYIEDRLAELEEEKEELKEFQDKDKERRCLEYALYWREVEEVGEALEELEEERKQDMHSANERQREFSKREKKMEELEKNIKALEHALSVLSLQKHGTKAELADLVRTRTELECVIDDLKIAGEKGEERRAGLELELQEVEEDIKNKEVEIMEIDPDLDTMRSRELAERKKLAESESRLDALYAKQGRLTKFRTKAERDAFLRKEIESIKAYRASLTIDLEGRRDTMDRDKGKLAGLEEREQAVTAEMEERKEKMRILGEDLAKWKETHADKVEQRKDLWREDTKLESTVSHERDELRSAERNLASMMDKDTGSGLRAVDRIAQRLDLDGVYGPLYRLCEISDPKYNTAVELTAGNSLFHVVVDTDETASKVLDIMIKEKTGRVTFMPLNRLKPKPVAFPQAPDAIPLIEKLKFDELHRKAFQQVFGKTCVCKDLTVAAAYVRSHNLNTITLDGDKVDRKGALTGGYHDVRRSRIEGVRAVKSWGEKYDKNARRLQEVKVEISKLEQDITKLVGQMQVANAQRNAAQTSREPLLREGAALEEERLQLKEKIQKVETDLENAELEIESLTQRLEDYERELASPMADQLTEAEVKETDRLGKRVDRCKQELLDLVRRRNELGERKVLIEIELRERLRRKREELRSKIESLGETDAGGDNSTEDLETRTRELKHLNGSIKELTDKSLETEKESEDLTAELLELKNSLEQVQTEQMEDSRGISRQQKNTERYLSKKQVLISRKDECNRNIRDLGVLPEEAFEKYTSEKIDRLVKKLHAVNEGLKKFAHVNKKAFEQYNNFTKQRDQLIKRREDLDGSAQSIEELVEVLDQRKDEAIERTFKQVASNFEEVFEKLVPAGRGRLIIQRKIDQDEEDVEEAEDTQQSSIDNYTGVSIKVSFNSKVDEGLRIQQLSGGQKSLVALATVFAIQKCDPAPFYLFDEIDANLDAQYRTAVAAMIHELSSTAQFITTTFRPEMLVSADQFYGVLFNNQKVSSIRSITRAEASAFIESETTAQ
ncbi:structural maintenance of chromosome protein 3 [Ramaria rubella]|nr:structural maintenance of chromosome protein 3 [Ramaria rubella]